MKVGILLRQALASTHSVVTGLRSYFAQAENDTSASYVDTTNTPRFISKEGVEREKDPYQVYVTFV